MAKYQTTVRSHLPPSEAFEFMADLRNFATWDPGVRSVDQVAGEGAGADAEFLVVVDGPGSGVDLHYRAVDYDAPRSITVEASSRWITSRDRIDVVAIVDAADGATSEVTYVAELTLNGPLGWADPAVRPFFNRIAGRAEAGLRRAIGVPA